MSTRILSSSTTGASPEAAPTGAGTRPAVTEHSASSQGSGDPAAPPEGRLPRHSVGRAIGIAVFAAAIVSAILLAFSWPTVTAEPKDLPIAAIGDEKQIDQVVDNAPEGMLDLKDADSRADAVDMIKHRDVYGALVLGDEPEILVSSAASPAVDQQLRAMAAQM